MEVNNLRLIVLENCKNLGELVNKNLQTIRGNNFNYIVPIYSPTFANSEGKVQILESVRGKDLFILTDIGNYDQTYTMYGKTNRKSYNDHFMETLQTIDACACTPRRIWVVEPLLYGSRQHKRESRESLNCSQGLKMMETTGIKGIISFDVHDPTVRSSLNKTSFDNIYPTNTMLNHFLDTEELNFNDLLVINPDSGATKRANYFGKLLNAPVGSFSKVRDLSKVINGTCAIQKHEYIGNVPFEGKNLIVVDDMIASGQSMLDVAESAKKGGANKVFLFSTFGLFSNGDKSIEIFNNAFDKNFIDKVYVTNLSYIPDKIKNLPWIEIVDCAPNIAKIIDTLNKDESIEPLMNGKEEIKEKIMQKKLASI